MGKKPLLYQKQLKEDREDWAKSFCLDGLTESEKACFTAAWIRGYNRGVEFARK